MLSDVGTIIDLSDDEWDFVADLFDPDGRRGTPAQHPRRRMVEAMLYLARTGCQWRSLPERFPAWEAVWSQWRRWRANGVWAAAMGRLARTIRADKRRYPEPSMVMLDAQTVRGGRAGPTFHAAGGRGGRTFGAKRVPAADLRVSHPRRPANVSPTPSGIVSRVQVGVGRRARIRLQALSRRPGPGSRGI